MNVNITDDELKLLALLHEHADGYGPRFNFSIDSIKTLLEIDEKQLRKIATYLDEHDLVGLAAEDLSTGARRDFVFIGIWLTGDGENYMRELEERLKVEEKQPGQARKITLRVVKEGGSLLRSIAVAVLTEYTKQKLYRG